ncbi:hypothetical protein, partial [Pseudomonas viridiflava]|uniref:hypothetical protein n=1 Tax=Pseudomonas viridiflava TaxID=33069 RepID=UPI0019CFA156
MKEWLSWRLFFPFGEINRCSNRKIPISGCSMNSTANRHSNYQTLIRLAETNWDEADKLKLSSLHVT